MDIIGINNNMRDYTGHIMMVQKVKNNKDIESENTYIKYREIAIYTEPFSTIN